MTNKKINEEQKKIENLKLRVERLINISQKKILDITEEFNTKVNKVYNLIELSEEKIRRLKALEDKEAPKELEYDFGIDWIHGETTIEVPVKFKKIEDTIDFIDDELL